MARAEKTHFSVWKYVAPRITNVMEWRDADKCLLASVLTLPFIALWIGRLAMVARNPHYGPYLNQDFLGPMLAFVWFQGFGHLAIIAAALMLRRRGRDMMWFIHLTTQFWYVCFFFSIYAVGPYTNPFAMQFLLAAVFGLMVFPHRPVFLGLGTLGALLVVSTIAERAGMIPYAPLMNAFRDESARLHTTWILSLGVIPLLASTLILAMFSYVIAQWRGREELLKELCRTDYLTGVDNRRSFMERAETEFVRARRFGNALAVVILDIDHFKRVNDGYGHGTGDEVLKVVAKILAAEVRRHDLLSRYGGEEFAVLLAETDEAQAHVMAERCRRKIEETRFVYGGAAIRVTASIGVAACPQKQVENVEQLIKLADDALYSAKSAGRNQVVIAA